MESLHIKVITSDNVEASYEKKHLIKCGTISDMIEGQDLSEAIPLPLTSQVMQRVVQFISLSDEHEYVPVQKPVNTETIWQQLPPCYVSFINDIAHSEIHDLIHAANFLNVPSLLDLALAKLATMIKGVSNDEMKEILHIRKGQN